MGYHIYAIGKVIRALFADRVTYTGGQSRDQSVFENGAMWARLRVCSVSRQDEWVVEEE